MKIKNKSSKKIKNLGYTVFYICTLSILALIGLFSSSFFAYKIFNSLFFNILNLVLIIALFVVLSIQNYLRQKVFFGKFFVITYYSIFILMFAFRPFVGNRTWAILLFFGLIAVIVLLILLAFMYVKTPENYAINRFCPIMAMVPALLLLMFAMTQNYIGSQGMWIPIVVGGIVLAIVSVFIFIKFFKSLNYFKKEGKSEFVFAVILIAAAAFMISAINVTTINYVFDGSSSIVEVEIIDKNISSGGRQVTSFNLKVMIQGKEKTILVPVDVYHAKNIGDSIEVNLYDGALGYGYYIYERPSS